MVNFGALAQRLFGSANERKLKRYWDKVAEINALEPRYVAMTDEELQEQTALFKDRLAAGETLDDILAEAFAVTREAAKRTLGQRHYDVQLVGGMVLHEGKIAEMKTGEGKTLVATLAVYLNALAGKGVHVVTVNDYLAKRDSDWMAQVYGFLGLTTDCIVHNLTDEERHAAYAADITYGTNNEFGFDYLRDNMKYSIETMVQRGHAYVIVDEVDSILIDEARTPLIISGPTEDLTELYRAVNELIPRLERGESKKVAGVASKLVHNEDQTVESGDYEVDEKQRQVTLTEAGNEHIEELLREADLLKKGSLYDIENIALVNHVNQALKAHALFQKDRDYIVKNDEVIIIDEFTGRMMEGRRFSEGLHQALEAKEGVTVQPENVTLSSVTFQNYFRLYDKLSGMTGTAMTEAQEFMDIYELDVMEIPTNLPVQRKDYDDEVYRSVEEKYDAICKLVKDCHAKGQPVLVGTVSIEKSETLSDQLTKRKIKHNVLNARHHDKEAEIVAQAGKPGAVTIATNMAGRGTDIQLGGNADMRIKAELADVTDPEEKMRRADEIRAEVEADKKKVLEAGGLYIVGTERHESRRIDNQLRGRAGRQGDPGASKFYLSLQDDLMRIFGSERMDSVLGKLGLEKGEAITHPWVNRALEKAQQKVEARNYEIRKNILKYDNVLNDQRHVIFDQRKQIMCSDDVSEEVKGYRQEVIAELVERHIPPKAYAEAWDTAGLSEEVLRIFDLDLPIQDWAQEEGIADEEVHERITKAVESRVAERTVTYTAEVMRYAEKAVLLQTLDRAWRDHIVNLDMLRQYVGLRGYGQRDPLNEYKGEAFELFERFLTNLRVDVVTQLMHLKIELGEAPEMPTEGPEMMESREDIYGNAPAIPPVPAPEADEDIVVQRPVLNRPKNVAVDPNDPSTWGKVPRNAPCPCGSGLKYKHCHGKFQ